MKILSVTNLNWVDAEQTKFDAVVEFEELGIVPYTASPDSTSDYGQEIWANGIAGEYGDIADYEEPQPLTPEELRKMMPKLEKWRVDTVIDLETGLRDKINAAIAKWPDPKRTIAKNKLASVTVFDRLDPLFDELGAEPEVGKTPDDIDAMWAAGAALPPALT
ncbi:MAG TPA: hypothetical protein GXX48_03065 [Ochrobactrum intermedium]|uniref:Uncharacterized protein n=1 Tax=Brucella intermedia TaxID=94625 RepID=A0A7V6TY94_9HYPH|nr:hypothetical protein [Brucella intermedia]HHV66615.1 hypothetical protein [Brucella intermedia]